MIVAAFGPSTWSNWVLAILAGVAACIGLRTLGKIRDQTEAAVEALNIGRMAADAAKRSAETAQRDLKLNARAQIVVRVVEPINGLSTGLEPFVTVHLVNIGRTPAYHAHYESWIDILEHPFRDFTPDGAHYKETTETLHYPEDKIVHSVPIRLMRPMEERENFALRTDKKRLYFRIRISYRDVFDDPRFTDFAAASNGIRIEPCPKYNECD